MSCVYKPFIFYLISGIILETPTGFIKRKQHMMVKIDIWLYGELAQYGDENADSGFANCTIDLIDGASMRDLLDALNLPTEARGITFINGNLSAMPGVQSDLNYKLQDNDRIAFFHQRTMWPYQYRQGAAMFEGFEEEIKRDKTKGIHHSYERKSE